MVHVCGWYGIVLVSFSEIGEIRPIFRWQRKAKRRMESLQATTPPVAGCMNASRSNGPKLPLEEERERERKGSKSINLCTPNRHTLTYTGIPTRGRQILWSTKIFLVD